MPRNVIGEAPFPPLVLFDDDRLFAADDLRRIAETRGGNGISVCIRYSEGPEKRGGYFFHFRPLPDDGNSFTLFDFERRELGTFSTVQLVRFINHCTGRKFDEDAFILCQTVLNFLKDEEPSA
jgi:hypothetical protein